MMRALYSGFFYCLVPFVLVRLLWRSRKEPLYRETIGERFGFCEPVSADNLVWVHAVSAGETNAAAPLVQRLLDRGFEVFVTTMTPTGRERVRAHFGERVHHAYAPYDLPGSVARFLDRTRPGTLVIVDTELWPNMIHAARLRGIRTLLVNARLSADSAAGYRRVGSLTRAMLAEVDRVATQTRAHADRFLALGLSEHQLVVAGSIKFDVRAPDDLAEVSESLRAGLGDRRIVIAASTHPGEEELVIAAFNELAAENLLLIVAPRHTRRADDVERLLRDANLSLVRRSRCSTCDERTRVLLLDTMGELMYFYSIAAVAVVGGSFVPDVGGHNPLEPISLGIPVVMGPHLVNIEDIAGQFVDAGGMLIAPDAASLSRSIAALLRDEGYRAGVVGAAAEVMAANRGALERVERLVVGQDG